MDVSQSFARTSRKLGIDYYFCSEACFKTFESNPARFQMNVGEPREISSGAYWVGVEDEAERLAINSYLIVGKKTALIYDTITRRRNDTLGKTGKVVDVERIDYLIPTHYFYGQCCGFSGVGKVACNSELIASETTTKLQTLAHLTANPCVGRTIPEAQEELIDLGGRKLRIFTSVLAGSYGSLFIYDDKSRILFSGDFLSSPINHWDAKIGVNELARSIKGYQTLRNPWLRLASKEKLRQEVSKLRSLKIDIIAPSEGTILRSGIDKCLEAYLDICDEVPN